MPNWKKLITSGSDAALNSLNVTSELTASGIFYPTVDGTDGQALVTDGSGNLTFGFPTNADDAEKVTFTVQNDFTSTLQKGTPIHITSTTNGTSLVIPASASDASTMPAHGILNSQLAVGVDGEATVLGQITGVDTSAFSSGDTVYVAPSGGYTNVKPQGSGNLIQNLGVVKKVDASNGTGEIFGAGRTNDVPNLPTGKVWVGSSTYSVTSSVVHLDETNERLGINTNTPGASLGVIGDISGSTKITVGYGLTNSGTNTAVFGINNTTLGNYSIIAGANNCITSFSNSSIAGGGLNVIGACCSFIGSGLLNCITGGYSTISSGVANKITAECSFIGAGSSNTGSDQRTFIGAGQCNKAGGGYTAIVGGFKNEVINYGTQTTGCAEQSFIGNGISNCIAGGGYGTIVGGFDNFVSASNAGFIGAGIQNTIAGGYASNQFSEGHTIAGGKCNKICYPAHYNSFIGGGFSNEVSCDFGTIGGGRSNCVTGGYASIIGGGCDNTVVAAHSTIVGGQLNCVCDNCSFIGGGCSNDIQPNSCFSGIVGGEDNYISSLHNFIGGGKNNCLVLPSSSIAGGFNNSSAANSNVHILGSNITADKSNYTFVNNLDVETNTISSTLSLTGLANQASEATAVMINGSNVVGTRELGTNAFNSTAFVEDNGGATNEIAFWSSATAISGSGDLTWDGSTLDTNGNLDVAGTVRLGYTGTDPVIFGNPAGKRTEWNNPGYFEIYAEDTDSPGTFRETIDIDGDYGGGGFIGVYPSNSTNRSGVHMWSQPDAGRNQLIVTSFPPTGVSKPYEIEAAYISGSSAHPGAINYTGSFLTVTSSYDNKITIGTCVTDANVGSNNLYVVGDIAGTTKITIGSGHTNSGTLSSVAGGINNSVTVDCSFIGGGKQNCITGGYTSAILGGRFNCIENISTCGISTIVGGQCNYNSGPDAFIGAGYQNCTNAIGGFIGGGSQNFVTGSGIGSHNAIMSSVVGGNVNRICGGTYSFIGGGAYNRIFKAYDSNIVGGVSNCISGSACSVIVAGGGNCLAGGYLGIPGFNQEQNFIGAGGLNRIDAPAKSSAIVAGCLNTMTGGYSSIVGGKSNCADTDCSFIGGGESNHIQDGHSSVIGGGYNNCVSGSHFGLGYQTIAGGCGNKAMEIFATVGGGGANCACGYFSVIGGGEANLVTFDSNDYFSGIFSGCTNTLTGNRSFIGGGSLNIINGPDDGVIAGGRKNCITGNNSFIGGGILNTGSAACGFIGGGCLNYVVGNLNTVTGGQSNKITNSSYSYRNFIGGGCLNLISSYGGENTIAGGKGNTISGYYSQAFIGGGYNNTTNSNYSSIVGGYSNCVTNAKSVIAGGQSNTISTYYSFIGAGNTNCITGTAAVIVGGSNNTNSGYKSFIGGGYNNTQSGDYGGILGGSSNTVNHNNSFIIGCSITTTAAAYTFMNNACVAGTTRTTTLVETSARRFKECILPLQDQIENIKKLEPVEFQWKKDKTKDIGFIAEDVLKVYPDLIAYEENGEINGIQYSKLTTVLVKALQQQQEQIDELKKEIFILKQQG